MAFRSNTDHLAEIAPYVEAALTLEKAEAPFAQYVNQSLMNDKMESLLLSTDTIPQSSTYSSPTPKGDLRTHLNKKIFSPGQLIPPKSGEILKTGKTYKRMPEIHSPPPAPTRPQANFPIRQEMMDGVTSDGKEIFQHLLNLSGANMMTADKGDMEEDFGSEFLLENTIFNPEFDRITKGIDYG